MYNEQIEALISAALADGMLTEKEKQILFKKAQAQGIDLDEFEIVLDARLVELEKAEKEKAAASAPKSTKYGDVRKCPVCGAMVPALAGTCPECGYEFSGVDANLSSKKLADKIEQEAAKWDEKIMKVEREDDKWQGSKEKEQAMPQIVKSFPIPNTKADIFEFITIAQTYFLGPSTNYYLAESFWAKYQEAFYKVKHLFTNDKMFEGLLEEQVKNEKQYTKIHKKQPKVGMKPSTKAFKAFMIGALVLLIALSLIIYFFGDKH